MISLYTGTHFSRESIKIIFAAQEKNGKFLSVIFEKMLIVHVRLEYLLVNYYDVPVDSTKDKVSVSGSISQGKDFFIDFLESFLIDDSVGTLLLKGSVEGTYFSCNELK